MTRGIWAKPYITEILGNRLDKMDTVLLEWERIPEHWMMIENSSKLSRTNKKKNWEII